MGKGVLRRLISVHGGAGTALVGGQMVNAWPRIHERGRAVGLQAARRAEPCFEAALAAIPLS